MAVEKYRRQLTATPEFQTRQTFTSIREVSEPFVSQLPAPAEIKCLESTGHMFS